MIRAAGNVPRVSKQSTSYLQRSAQGKETNSG
jgi:hypothetical protein